MLKVLQPEPTIFHNFKCGEIFCLNPTNYNVTCSLCGIKVPFEKFPVHFQAEHLSQTLGQTPGPDSIPLVPKEDVVDFIKSEDNPSGSDNDEPDTNISISNPVEAILDDEQPIDFEDLNFLQTDQTSDNDEFFTIADEKDKREEKKEKKEKRTDPDWRKDDSSSEEESPKQTDIDSLPHPCPDCMRSYKTRRSMLAHHRLSHNPNKKPNPPKTEFKCDECGEIFKTERNLRGHRWKHFGHVCDICGKTLSQKSELVVHKIRHTGIKSHKCQECGNAFFTDRELKAHMVRHTGERPFVCEICGKGCRNSSVYKYHMRRHTGERPAKCEVCGKAFYSFHDLNVHSVQHSKERPFACDICGSTFQLKKALRVHKKLHSKDRNHECKVCGKAFAQSGGLNAHMRSHDAAPGKTIGTSTNKLSGITEALSMGTNVNMSNVNEMNLPGTSLDSASIAN